MTSDESGSGDTNPQSTDSPSEGRSVEYREPNANADPESDGEAVDNADVDGSDEDANYTTDDGLGEDAEGSADDEPGEDTEDNTEDEPSDPESISRIERILIDPDDVLETMAYNGQEEIGRKGKAVFSVTPPFDETVEPTLKQLGDESTKHGTDGEINLRPFRFVVDGRRIIEQRPTRQLAMEELDVDDPDDAMIEAWIDEAMATWKAHIRDNFTDSVEIFSPHGMAVASVEYQTDSE